VQLLCTRGVQNHKKDSQVISLFTLSGSAGAKAVPKYVGEIDPRKPALFDACLCKVLFI